MVTGLRPKTVERVALPDQVHEILRERIFDRMLAPGDRLNIEALARELKVSATPVREALSRLSAEGLVKFEPYVGVSVAPIPGLAYYGQLYDLRLVLEPWAASEAAKRQDAAAIKDMETAAQAMEDTELSKRYRRFRDFADADEAFHRAIFGGSGNEPAMRAFLDLKTHLHLSRLYIQREHFTDEARNFHQSILAAIKAGDSALAHAQMHAHLAQSKFRLLGQTATNTSTSEPQAAR
jgi:DNA-binding GntR family transcriptional regulator